MDPDINVNKDDGERVWQYNARVNLTQKRRDRMDRYLKRPIDKFDWETLNSDASGSGSKTEQQVEQEEEDEFSQVKV